MRHLSEQHPGAAPLPWAVALLLGGGGIRRLSDQRATGGGGVGATTLHDLTDVDDAGKADTNVLAYESASGKWKPAAAGTPAAHHTSHESGGSDAIKLDNLAAPDDNTDLDATVTAHGLLKKLGGGTTNFLRADGTWAAPPGGGGALDDLSDVDAAAPSDGDVLTWAAGSPGEWVAAAPSGGPGGGGGGPSRSFTLNAPPDGTQTFYWWKVPVAITITKILSLKVGGGTCTVNVKKNGTSILGANQTPGSATWTASSTLTTSVAAGDTLDILVESVSGMIPYLVVQVDFETA